MTKQTTNTAIVIIHGIGQQSPYETLDKFGRGFIEELKQYQIPFGVHHRIEEMGLTKKNRFTKNYIRLSLQGEIDKNIDIYEYYWANLTEQQASLREIEDWLKQTLAGARKYWDENRELQEAYEKREQGSANSQAYWGKLNQLLKYGSWIYKVIINLRRLLPKSGWGASVTNLLGGKAAQILVDFVGDVTVYTTTDVKKENNAIRKEILKGSTQLVETLMHHPRYDQVLVCGHSLGSVIAFDTLNKLNIKANVNAAIRENAKKITGLVTFGSPLDKIAFFFRQQSEEGAYVRKQMLSNLYAFKTKNWQVKKEEQSQDVPTIKGIKQFFDHIRWFNFYHENDPVSGSLDFYKADKNISRVFEKSEDNRWGYSHVGYWEDLPMYRELIKEFL